MTEYAIALLDAFLAEVQHQSLVDAARLRDLLLDVRSALTADEPE